jgi:hypothetical protein
MRLHTTTATGAIQSTYTVQVQKLLEGPSQGLIMLEEPLANGISILMNPVMGCGMKGKRYELENYFEADEFLLIFNVAKFSCLFV